MMRAPVVAISSALLCVGATGCGGGSTTSSTRTVAPRPPTKAAPRLTVPSAAVRRAVAAYARADTPNAVCSLMSYGYKLAVARGQDPLKCTSWIVKRLGPFKATSAAIISTTNAGGQILVVALFGSQRQALFLIRQCGSLKLASIGAPRLHQPSPPTCRS